MRSELLLSALCSRYAERDGDFVTEYTTLDQRSLVNNAPGESPYEFWLNLPDPEIYVSDDTGTNEIVAGSTVNLSGSETSFSFLAHNVSGAPLEISSVSFDGSHTNLSFDTTPIGSGNSSIVTIDFDPIIGPSPGQVTLVNTDLDESSYEFFLALDVTQQVAWAVKMPPPVGAFGDATGSILFVYGSEVDTNTQGSTPTLRTFPGAQSMAQTITDSNLNPNTKTHEFHAYKAYKTITDNPGLSVAALRDKLHEEIVKLVKKEKVSTIYFIGHRWSGNEGGFDVFANPNNLAAGRIWLLDKRSSFSVPTDVESVSDTSYFLNGLGTAMDDNGFTSGAINIVACADPALVTATDSIRENFANAFGGTVAGSTEKMWPLKADQDGDNTYEASDGDGRASVLGLPDPDDKDTTGLKWEKRWPLSYKHPSLNDNRIGGGSGVNATIHQ